jgi:hypothetical protein
MELEKMVKVISPQGLIELLKRELHIAVLNYTGAFIWIKSTDRGD